jgi:SAM-dependent methyltransferase
MEKTSCRLCGNTRLREVHDFGSVPVGDRYRSAEELPEPTPVFPLALRCCEGCGHWQLRGVVEPDLLYGHYLYETGTSPGLVQHFQAYADSVREVCGLRDGDLAVDIGSNSGVLLERFQRQGLRVLGVEPATAVAQGARQRGIPTRNAYFTGALVEQLVREEGRASLITANNVLANIDDLDAVFEAMKALLEEEGVIIVETGYAVDTVGQFVVDNLYHEHISYFAVAPMQRFLGARGLRLFHVDRVATKGGSIRMFICRVHSKRPEHATVQGLIHLEAELGFQDGSAGAAFTARAQQLKTILRARLAELAQQGALVGYGASVGATTLLYWLEAGAWFECLVDDNPIKQGRFSPGFHVPVLAPSALVEKQPAVVVNLAWRYLHILVRKNQDYLAQGGTFQQLLPWPWVTST